MAFLLLSLRLLVLLVGVVYPTSSNHLLAAIFGGIIKSGKLVAKAVEPADYKHATMFTYQEMKQQQHASLQKPLQGEGGRGCLMGSHGSRGPACKTASQDSYDRIAFSIS